MDSNTKQLLAVFSLMLGLSWGIPYLVSEEKNSSWLMLSIIFLGLALLLWFWVSREQRSSEEAARDALDAAEENLNKLKADATDSTPVSRAPVAEVVDEVEEDIEEVVETVKEEVVEAVSVAEEVVEEVAETVEEEIEEVVEADTAISVDVSELEAEEEAEITNDTDAVAEDLAEDAVDDDGDVDLTIIEGIGPKYAEILVAAGVKTFAKLGGMTTDEIIDLVKANGGRKSGSMSTWSQQAQLAAAGDWDALEKLQDDLTGGRAK